MVTTHFVMSIIVEQLCCTPEINTISHVKCTKIFLKSKIFILKDEYASGAWIVKKKTRHNYNKSSLGIRNFHFVITEWCALKTTVGRK